MDVELLQDLINVLSYAIASRGEGVPELLEILKYEFDDENLVENHPDEIRSAFGSAQDGEMYHDYLAWERSGIRGVVRSSLDKQMENTVRITKRQLKRIIRESFDIMTIATEIVEELAGFEPQGLANYLSGNYTDEGGIHLNSGYLTPNADKLLRGIRKTGYFRGNRGTIERLERAVYEWCEQFPEEAEELLVRL